MFSSSPPPSPPPPPVPFRPMGAPQPQGARHEFPRSILVALAATGLIWMAAAHAAAGEAATAITHALHLPILTAILRETLSLLLLLAGYTALSWVATRRGQVRTVNALPARATVLEEWQRGAALGWGVLVVAVLPMMLAGDLHPQFWWQPRSWLLAAASLLALLVGSLVTEVAYRGFVYRCLIDAVGPTAATILGALVYAALSIFQPNTGALSFLVALAGGFLFSAAYLRTRALWLGWGLRFGWLVAMGVIFGLPIDGSSRDANLVATDVSGAAWLTGGAYGPEGALPALLALVAGIAVLYAVTRDYAWNYTFDPIEAAGYPMDVAPPPAHAAMEAAAPKPLVQIQMATPVQASSMQAVNEHFAGQRGEAAGDDLHWGSPLPETRSLDETEHS